MEITMWPYNQDEVTWLALPGEHPAAEQQTPRVIDRAWLVEVGVRHEPANDLSPRGAPMVDPRR
jgi:hypothetical protein